MKLFIPDFHVEIYIPSVCHGRLRCWNAKNVRPLFWGGGPHTSLFDAE